MTQQPARQEQAKPEGYRPGPEHIEDSDFQVLHSKFMASSSMADMADEYVYFSHGLLFTHGYWRTDPIIEHISETGGACAPFAIQTPIPVFKWFDGRDQRNGNIVDSRWNSQVCVVQREHWPDLYRFICLTEGRNNDTKTMTRPVPQLIPIVDTLALSKLSSLPEKIPTVDCFCFALLSTRRTVYFAPELRGRPWNPVPVMSRDPDPAYVKYSKSIFSGHPTPLAGSLEPTLDEAVAALLTHPDARDKIVTVVDKSSELNRQLVDEYNNAVNSVNVSAVSEVANGK